MQKIYRVGLMGCGNISGAYGRLLPLFKNLNLVACADLNHQAAVMRAKEAGIEAMDVDALLARDDIDVIVNLTVPDAHFAVSKNILEAGKHVYSEKPFVLSLQEGEVLRALANEKGLRVGSAPDTFLGGAHQMARHLIESGEMGTITSGMAHVLSPGMEAWHPNPDFFFQKGGGPVLDMGPYYITNLVNLVGPVKRLTAMGNKGRDQRVINNGPRKGEPVPVDVDTNVHAILECVNGAIFAFSASWDVYSTHHQSMIELYGTQGALHVPDPNFFGGPLKKRKAQDTQDSPVDIFDHPFYADNWGDDTHQYANYRGAGLAEMMAAFGEGRDHRCSLDRALHVMDVLLSILKAAETGERVDIQTPCTQPAPLGPDEARALLK